VNQTAPIKFKLKDTVALRVKQLLHKVESLPGGTSRMGFQQYTPVGANMLKKS
jgi:hypothetical protein